MSKRFERGAAYAALGVGEFLKAFAAERDKKKALEREDRNFERELAMKRLEDEQRAKYERFKAEMDAQQALLNVTKAGAKKAMYDASGKLVGYEEAGIDPATVVAGQRETEAIRDRYLGVQQQIPFNPSAELMQDSAYEKPTMFPGMPSSTPTPSLFGLPPEQATQTGLRPPASFKTVDKSSSGSGSGGGTGQDEFWKTFDREFAKTAQAWETRGRSEAKANVDALNKVATQFETGDVESRPRAILPGRAVIAPKVDQAIKTVEKVIFPQLRATMGAQFTEKEGKRVIDATIDPAAPAENNAARVRALEAVMLKQNDAVEAMTEYAKKNGTMKGYTGPQQAFTNTDELLNALDSAQKTPSPATQAEGADYIWDAATQKLIPARR